MIGNKGESTFLKVCLPLDESETALVSDKDEACSPKAKYVQNEKKKNQDYIDKIKSNNFFKKKKRSGMVKLLPGEKLIYKTDDNKKMTMSSQDLQKKYNKILFRNLKSRNLNKPPHPNMIQPETNPLTNKWRQNVGNMNGLLNNFGAFNGQNNMVQQMGMGMIQPLMNQMPQNGYNFKQIPNANKFQGQNLNQNPINPYMNNNMVNNNPYMNGGNNTPMNNQNNQANPDVMKQLMALQMQMNNMYQQLQQKDQIISDLKKKNQFIPQGNPQFNYTPNFGNAGK